MKAKAAQTLLLVLSAAGFAACGSGSSRAEHADDQGDADSGGDHADAPDAGGSATDSGSVTDSGTVTDSGSATDSGIPLVYGDLDAGFIATELLSRPTAVSVAVSAVPRQDTDVFFEYGLALNAFTKQTASVGRPGGEPFAATMDGLDADKRYYYRMRWREPDGGIFVSGPERSFHTARPRGQSFVFDIQADPHLDDQSNLDLYHYTLVPR